jgi:hypothetical protein
MHQHDRITGACHLEGDRTPVDAHLVRRQHRRCRHSIGPIVMWFTALWFPCMVAASE